jgi:signal transduction histidine kinase
MAYGELRVSDHGPGIPGKYKEWVFDRYKQVQSDSDKGFGLGLAICKSIVKKHGGAIGVESGTNGSEFWIRIPSFEERSDSAA